MMCSTRKTNRLAAHTGKSVQRWSRAVLLLLAGAAITGCEPPPPPRPAPQPAAMRDPAMQKRQWSQSTALYPNGGIKSWSTRQAIPTPYRGDSRTATTLLDTGAFIGNTIVMPFTLITTPPFTPVVYHGEQIPPTYNAMPPLPPQTTHQ